MGLAIDREEFSAEEYKAFSERLYQCLEALKHQMQTPRFGQGQHKIGAELENYIVDSNGDVLALNKEIIEAANKSNYTVELNKFNLEINFEPVDVSNNAFSSLQAEMDYYLGNLRRTAKDFSAQIIPIGILPTLSHQHLTPEFMSDFARYRALSKSLYQMRGEHFQVHINGEDELLFSCDHVGLEGANTSFQFHLMIEPQDFSRVFNATQLTSALAVAVSANSPILLNKKLWDETRIALFKQSIDSRLRNSVEWRQPSRVSFGHGWVRENAWELFAETVALYPPIFPVLSKEEPLQMIQQGKTPNLEELCLHMGTTWPWNRAVYCGSNDGHVRIEMRSLPAGPTNKDMCANVAFATGLALGLKDSINDFLAIMPFRFAEYNFYRAAQNGLDASIVWTDPKKHQPIEMPIIEVISAMLPVAERGLKLMGISDEEIKYYLSIIEQRIEKKMTGARWQKQMVKHFEQNASRKEACYKMFHRYREQQSSGFPVAEWELS